MNARPASSLFDARPPRIFSIGPHLKFLDELAAAIVASVGGDQGAALADVEIYLPTRRAARALADAFLALAGDDAATFIPKIRAVGDVDEDEITPFRGAPADEMELPPAVSDVERRITLARLVAAKDHAPAGEAHWTSALAAADELASLIDAFYTEEIDPGVLGAIAPDDLAEHWARSLEFLDIVTRSWPAHLREIGRMDPAARRVRLINRLADAYEKSPPAHPVIIAGTTGSTPAVARLIGVVANLPKGCVVLPGVDLSMDEAAWGAIDDPHPQSGLKHLLETGLDLDRRAVKVWPGADRPDTDQPENALRSDIVSVALRPAAVTDSWRDWAEAFKADAADLTHSLAGLSLVEAEDDEREADAIALKIRAVVSEAERTVFLATPDRDLSRRVAAKLQRWDIHVDDSAGAPFGQTRCGGFLRLMARLISNPADPAALASVMRHPLFGGGVADERRAGMVNAADLALRGLKPDALDSVIARLSRAGPRAEALAPLVERLRADKTDAPSLQACLTAHIALAEAFAATDKASGADRLWRGEDGEAGAARIAALIDATATIRDWAPSDYHDIFDQLIGDIAIRRRSPAHRRVAIFGPLEARLQSADVVILGGLNEGVWPRDAAIDGFLSRGMRKSAGLPSPERRIGLSAHDFAQLSAASEVLLTRSKKTGGKPATPSRWIVRLKNILGGAGALAAIDRTYEYGILSERLDDAPLSAGKAPAPRPPVASRPTHFSVTRVETLLRDPYAVYAKSVLGLDRLDAFNEPIDPRHVGNLFHRIFERYAGEAPPGTHDARVARLEALFERCAADSGFGAAHAPFWRARARAAFEWFADWDAARREEGAPAIIEERGEWRFEHEGRQYALVAKADRIDLLKTGAAAVFDYKTGAPPPTDKQQKTFSPQLPLTAAIVRAGGFAGLGAVPVDRFAYLRVQNRKPGSRNESGAAGADCAAKIDEAERGLKDLITHFNNPDTAYPSQPRPQYMAEFGDYDHLARRRERRAMDGAE